ncbi:MAG: hypothetical protein V1726_04035, partial [Methanobacteriota archaeon]
ILRKKEETEWIHLGLSKDRAQSLLVPYDEQEMEAYTISRLITSRTQDPNTPDVLKPYHYPELHQSSGQTNLF